MSNVNKFYIIGSNLKDLKTHKKTLQNVPL